jgi:uncharacterized protein YecE (DUF72 family)
MESKKVIPFHQPSLFDDDKSLDSNLSATLPGERPCAEPGLLLGTSAFSANGWVGSFYPGGTNPRQFLVYYSTRFQTVEVDSTFYATPSAATVRNWYQRTPPDFIFAAKVPQIVTHDKMLVDCEAEFDEFIDRMNILDEKLGPLLFQFPKFDKSVMHESEFLRRLRNFLARIKDLPKVRFVVEIRNRQWLTERLLDALRENRVALALSDTTFMPRPWEQKLDLLTTDFIYVRWLGDRKGIERETLTWDKTIVDRAGDLRNWAELFKTIRRRTPDLKIYAYANNHYQGHGPNTVKLLWDLYKG